jgi:glycosyltransferase involved in cell wall biosynthesis
MASAKLTVLQVLPALESGGVERGTLEVAKALVQHGHRSIVMSAGGRLVDELLADGSEHITWPIGKKSLLTFLLIPKLRRLWRDEHIDIVHVRSRLPAWVVYLAWKGMHKKTRPSLVTTVHGFYSVGRYSSVMTKGERVIAVSCSIESYIRKNYPHVFPANIRMIYRGVDVRRYPYGYQPTAEWLESWYQQYPQLKGRYVVTLPGRITRLKGHEDFLHIINKLLEQGVPVTGLIVGGADASKQSYLNELEHQVTHMHLQDHMIFTGHRSDLREVMAVSDVVLSLSSQPESFGRTTLEALSMGVPVCAYNHGGVAEQLEEILPDGLVRVGEMGDVVEKLVRWHRDRPEILSSHSFSLGNMQDRTLRVYHELALQKQDY